MGKRNAPSHRIVVADNRSPRDGRFIEILGYYNPREKNEKIDVERAQYWLSQGAQPSDTVASIIKRAQAGISLNDKKVAMEAEAAKKAEAEAKKAAAEAKKAEEKAAKEAAAAAAAAAEEEAAQAEEAGDEGSAEEKPEEAAEESTEEVAEGADEEAADKE
jgi:small subunit ribosomal protein S16